MKQPPLPLSDTHRALLLACGVLDGIVEPPGEQPHVVRGTCRKVQHLLRKDTAEDRTTCLYTERVEIVIRTIDQEGNLCTMRR